jgi:hypothetical protein
MNCKVSIFVIATKSYFDYVLTLIQTAIKFRDYLPKVPFISFTNTRSRIKPAVSIEASSLVRLSRIQRNAFRMINLDHSAPD